MKTLVLDGAVKKNGDTHALLEAFLDELEGEVRVVGAQDDIAPCCDCRSCWKKKGCAIKDGMQEVYDWLEESDCVVLASPIWYSSLSGPLLNIASRMQTLFIGRYRRAERHEPHRHGVLILAGAQKETRAAPEAAAMVIMRTMGVMRPLAATVVSLDTDRKPAREDETALQAAREAARTLNRLCAEKR